MTSSSVRAWSRRATASVSSGSLALLAVAAVPTAAGAVSATIDYACTAGTTPFSMSLVLDTSLPQRMTSNQSTQVVLTAKGTLALSKSQAQALAGGPVTHVRPTVNAAVGIGATPANAALPVVRTALTEPTTAVNASSGAIAYTAPATPGTLEVTAGGLTGTLNFDNNNEGNPTTSDFTCSAPNGKPPVIDTISVAAPTTTTLTVAKTTAAFGQDVAASATVTSPSGVPSGEVSFTVGGTVTRARVDRSGVASLVLPDRPVGTHSVTATFVPTDPLTYIGGTSVTKLLTVSKAETKVRVPVTGKRSGTVTRIGVKATGAYDTVPTGKVKFTLKRLGKAGRWSRVRTLAGGSARVGFGSLKVGRYKAVVKYAGDASHLSAKKVATFRVKPG